MWNVLSHCLLSTRMRSRRYFGCAALWRWQPQHQLGPLGVDQLLPLLPRRREVRCPDPSPSLSRRLCNFPFLALLPNRGHTAGSLGEND